MRKKMTWITLVLALVLCLGTLGIVFAGSYGTISDQDGLSGGHPHLPTAYYDYSSPLDDLSSNSTAFKFVGYTFWLLP